MFKTVLVQKLFSVFPAFQHFYFDEVKCLCVSGWVDVTSLLFQIFFSCSLCSFFTVFLNLLQSYRVAASVKIIFMVLCRPAEVFSHVLKLMGFASWARWVGSSLPLF
jgi:hypothetical protein